MRNKSIERPPAGRSIHIVMDGKDYDATFTVDGPTVVVQSATLGVKVAHLVDNPPEVQAMLLLAELVHQSERAGDHPADPDSQVGAGLVYG